MDVDAFLNQAISNGFNEAVTVPCSYLTPLLATAWARSDFECNVASDEGEALAYAAGRWMTGNKCLIMIQNSGLGNLMNPLTSLNLVYKIPATIMVSLRGKIKTDAPQHRIMGKFTRPFLQSLNVKTHLLRENSSPEEAIGFLRQTCSRRNVGALLVPKGTFVNSETPPPSTRAPFSPTKKTRPCDCLTATKPTKSAATRMDMLAAIKPALDGKTPVVTSTGLLSRDWHNLGDDPANFYMQGSMGCALAIGSGLGAGTAPRRVVVIDGDGSFLMRLGAVPGSLARCPHLLHVVIDNGCHETTGGQPSLSGNIEFNALAAGLGYDRIGVTGSVKAASKLFKTCFHSQGSSLLVLKTIPNRETATKSARPTTPLPEIAGRMKEFMKSLRVFF